MDEKHCNATYIELIFHEIPSHFFYLTNHHRPHTAGLLYWWLCTHIRDEHTSLIVYHRYDTCGGTTAVYNDVEQIYCAHSIRCVSLMMESQTKIDADAIQMETICPCPQVLHKQPIL